MTEISRTALFGKLNNVAYKGIESATVFCKMRGNAYVELVHWLHQILQLQDSDLHRIIKRFELNPAHLARDFTDSLDRLPAGATSISDLSAHVEQAVEQGWLYASLMYGSNQVRTVLSKLPISATIFMLFRDSSKRSIPIPYWTSSVPLFPAHRKTICLLMTAVR